MHMSSILSCVSMEAEIWLTFLFSISRLIFTCMQLHTLLLMPNFTLILVTIIGVFMTGKNVMHNGVFLQDLFLVYPTIARNFPKWLKSSEKIGPGRRDHIQQSISSSK